MTYHCKNHDYVYYAVGWRDANTGTSYEPGYYDENGQYYEDVAFKDKTSGILTMKCEYCESVIRTNWTEGTKPNCPNCGAVLKIEKADELLNSYKESSYRNSSYKPEAKSGGKWHPVIMVLMLLMLLGGIMEKEPIVALLAVSILVVSTPFVSKFLSKSAFVWTCIGLVVVCALLQSFVTDIRDDNWDNSGYTSGDNSIYVEPLGRSCDWYDEYDSYYDPETDCYFAYNYDSDTWQYWYEGISSDFGDYGWMEYDENEKQWYIETSNGHWEVLPAKYDTAKLWHISDDSDQATEAAVDQNINSGSIYVDALGRSCDWDDEYETFYDKETDCYFWYNTDINPPCWQYWYEGISSDFGDYGWMEYDEDEDQWYIEASQGNWIVLPKGYDTDKLWHIEV
ncbi:MAG: hypothetical protein KBS83_00735 [Lachnospiraceae bacterium]|nr:hypothetical protein [Candidatus Equihabitans merdae]